MSVLPYSLGNSLRHAACSGDIAAILRHLDGGGDVNATLHDLGGTLLSEAVGGHQTALVELLLKRGADVDRAYPKATPLQLACCHDGNFDITRMLLDAGADVNGGRDSGRAPIQRVFRPVFYSSGPTLDRMMAVVRLLHERGAVLDAAHPEDAALFFRHETGVGPHYHLGLARLIDELKIDVAGLRDTHGTTPLFRCRKLEAAQVLLERGLDVNARDDRGDTALHSQSRTCTPGIVGLLVDYGADMNAANNAGVKPLHDACASYEPEAVLELMQCRPDTGGTLPKGLEKGTSVEEVVVDLLWPRFATFLAGSTRYSLGGSVAWLKWLLTCSPLASARLELQLPVLKERAARARAGRWSHPHPHPLTRDEVMQPLKDNAWEKRKHLVCCYFQTRRLRREAANKRPKTEEEDGKANTSDFTNGEAAKS